MKLGKIILTMMTVALAACFTGCNSTESSAEALYELFANREGLMVARLDGMRLNDTVKVDVVIVEADGEAQWLELCQEFDIRSQSGVTTWTCDPVQPQRSIRYEGQACCKLIASPARRTICFYQLEDSIQYESLMDYRMGLMETGE